MVEFLEIAPGVAAAVLLGGLWLGEALWPLIERRDRREAVRVRARNLALGLINAATSGGFAALTLGVAVWGGEHGLGLLRALRGGLGLSGGVPAWGEAVLFVVALVALDLWHYAFHVMAHKAPLLWRFHVVHHHDPIVQATTAVRFHAGEIGVQHLLSLPVYLLLGVDIVHVLAYQLVLLPVAIFHHANIRMPEWVDRGLRWLVVTPRMHIVHHSAWTPETDSNFASVLSVWDRVFGTYRWREDPSTIDVGLNGYDDRDTSTLRGMLMAPREASKADYGEAPDPRLLPKKLRAKDRRAGVRHGALASRH